MENLIMENSFSNNIADRPTLIKISGIQCSFCTQTIEKALKQIDGVSQVGISLAHEEVFVKYNTKKTSLEKIKQTLINLGFAIKDPDSLQNFIIEQEERDILKKELLVGFFLSLVSLSMMILMWSNVSFTLIKPIMLTVSLLMVFGVGNRIALMAFASLKRGIWNQHVLMMFAAIGGIVGGIVGFFKVPWPSADFFGASIFITLYHILSAYVSLIVKQRSSEAILKLLALKPDTARVIKGKMVLEMPVEEVLVGDILLVHAGEKIPVDGTVMEGFSTVDESIVTGETFPIAKEIGNEVIGGSINLEGTLKVKVTKPINQMFLSQVARLMQEARTLRPRVLQLVEKVLKYFVPGVVVIALSSLVLWLIIPLFLTGKIEFDKALLSSLAALVMGYPCALGMSTPLAMIRGGGMAARKGILIRSGEAFQVFKDVSFIVMDKTGTITYGKPIVDRIITLPGVKKEELIAYAASLESHSNHPFAKSIVNYAKNNNVTFFKEVSETQTYPGRGIKGKVLNQLVIVGRLSFLQEEGIAIPKTFFVKIRDVPNASIVGVARNGDFLGAILIQDLIREKTKETIAKLKSMNIIPIIASGDHKRVVEEVATNVGIEKFYAEVYPSDKARIIKEIQQNGAKVAFVGDGINDAPALTQADVGIGLSTGTDIAIESAEIIILREDLKAVIDAYEITKKTYRKTKQNVTIAFIFNGIGVPLAAFGILHPVFAMIAMATSVTLILLNSFPRVTILKDLKLVDRKQKICTKRR